LTTGGNLNLRGESTNVGAKENTPLTLMFVELLGGAPVDVVADDDAVPVALPVDVDVGEGSPY
jgi:hypothetical protein